MNRIIYLTVLLCTLTGCPVGPNFKTPEQEITSKWQDPNNPDLNFSISEPVVKWWESFNDPTLNELISEASKNNIDLKQAVSRIRQARASRTGVIASLFPSINISGAYRKGSTGDSPLSSDTTELFQNGLDAAWELDIFGGIRRKIEVADANLLAEQENRNFVFISLTSEIAINYFSLRAAQQQLEITRNNLATQEKTAELIKKRLDVGFANALDYANASALAASTKAQIPSLEAEVQKSIYELSFLLAQEPEELNFNLHPIKMMPTPPNNVPLGFPSELLRRRPDIRQAEAKLHAATAQVGVATAELFPKFTITADLGIKSSSFADLYNSKNSFWTFLPNVSLPIFNAGRLISNVEVQKEIREQALLNYEKTVLNALKEVATALVDYKREQERQISLKKAVTESQKSIEFSRNLYEVRQIDFLDVLTAQRSVYSAEISLVQSTRTISTNLIALYKALGGGWQNLEIAE